MGHVLQRVVAHIIQEEILKFRDEPETSEIVILDAIPGQDTQERPSLLDRMCVEIALRLIQRQPVNLLWQLPGGNDRTLKLLEEPNGFSTLGRIVFE